MKYISLLILLAGCATDMPKIHKLRPSLPEFCSIMHRDFCLISCTGRYKIAVKIDDLHDKTGFPKTEDDFCGRR